MGFIQRIFMHGEADDVGFEIHQLCVRKHGVEERDKPLMF